MCSALCNDKGAGAMIAPSVKVKKTGVWQQEVCIVATQSLKKLPSATWQVEGQGRMRPSRRRTSLSGFPVHSETP